MTYQEALAEAKRVGVSRCSDPALMASFLDANAQILIGAVSPELMWDGAQKTGLTTKALVALIHKDPIEAAELMWV
jgi:hypothetical protein